MTTNDLPRPNPGRAKLLGATTLLIIAAGSAAGLFLVPADALQGEVQRLLYVHVPAAWLAMLAFFVVFVMSVLYLIQRDSKWDLLAVSAVGKDVEITMFARVAELVISAPGILQGRILHVGAIPPADSGRFIDQVVQRLRHDPGIQVKRLYRHGETADLGRGGLDLGALGLADDAGQHQAGDQRKYDQYQQQFHQCESTFAALSHERVFQ